MRILVATDQWSPDVVGGSARVARGTAQALARRDHEIVVLAPAVPGLPAFDEESGVEVRRVLRRGRLPQTLSDTFWTYRCARRLRGRSFDVLVAHQATNAVGLEAARLGLPLAFVFHASPVLELRFLREHGARGPRSYALEPLLARLEWGAVARAAGIFVLSHFSEQLVRSRYPGSAERLRLVSGGVDDVFFADRSDQERWRERLGVGSGLLVLTARRLEPRMGVENLVEALSLLDDERVVLAVAGTGPSENEVARRARDLGLGDRVRLLGRVSEDDLRSLYAAADLFVLPSVAYEGFGMSTVEALAAGTPVLGTAVGATPEIVADLGADFVAATADPGTLATAIGRVLPLLGAELRSRARRLAEERYRWDVAIGAWEDALLAVARR